MHAELYTLPDYTPGPPPLRTETEVPSHRRECWKRKLQTLVFKPNLNSGTMRSKIGGPDPVGPDTPSWPKIWIRCPRFHEI
jgi:hypothetical protein